MRPEDLGFGRLFERVRDAIMVADAETQRIVLWNQAATKMFGYSLSEALELRVEVLVPDPLKAQHRTGMARNAETDHRAYIDSYELLDLPALRKDGEEIRVELSLSPIEPADGEADGPGRFVLAIVREVTARKKAEEEVRRLNETLEEQVGLWLGVHSTRLKWTALRTSRATRSSLTPGPSPPGNRPSQPRGGSRGVYTPAPSFRLRDLGFRRIVESVLSVAA